MKDENGDPIENAQFKRETVMFPMKLKTWYNTLVELDEANNKIYYMFCVQCSLAMITKIERSKGFKAAQENLEVIRLLALIHAIMCGVEQHVHPTMSIMLMYKNIFCLWKKPGQTNDDYNKLFHSYKTVLKSLVRQIPAPMELMLEHFIKTSAISKGGITKDT